ncbi:toll/interleukin-1 receptor domain-containing protein [Amycolatopsis sp. NPDC021455]|uniref:toll/interleukin-1 receptor domain-containing protein n=1 Tax=Amycolatopsis sp. NPDC021455 TaxID=3154901 RepID=UPI0033DE0B3E
MTTGEAKHVFVSYVREDEERVDKLCAALTAAQIPYWRDRTSLAPGDQWRQKVREAIRSEALIFLACFSEQSRAKPKSYMNEELTLAVEEFRQYPPETTWLIPVRFDDGEIPAWDLGAGRTLGDLNYADLFGDRYLTNMVSLMTSINTIMGPTGPDPATVRASVEEAEASDRVAALRRLTKEMVVDSRRRIELDDLISQEARGILTALRDETKYPPLLPDGSDEDRLVRCAEIVSASWQLVEPFVTSLQIAARWADGHTLMPWISALKAITGEALKPQGGNTTLLGLRHAPALAATFTAAFAATGQGRWDNLKALLVDATVPKRYGGGREPLIDAENPWTPFEDWQHLLPNLVARAAKTGEDPRTALNVFKQKQQGKYHTPVAEWLHAVIRSHFLEQFADDSAYDDAFGRTEVILGLISQDLQNARAAANPERVSVRHSRWFGRSAWQANYGGGMLAIISSEIDDAGSSWAPLATGLFGGELARAQTAAKDYAEDFRRFRHW